MDLWHRQKTDSQLLINADISNNVGPSTGRSFQAATNQGAYSYFVRGPEVRLAAFQSCPAVD